MHKLLAIVRREFAAYFNTPLGYILLVYFLLAYGVFFFYVADVFEARVASMRTLFGFAPLALAWTTPAVTMRLLAEERSSGTIELLVTLPLSEWHIVVGKYLAALGVVALGALLTATYPLTLMLYGDIDLGPVLGGYAGLMLVAASYVALGLLCSALARSQVVAALSAFWLGLLAWAADKLAWAVPGLPGDLLRFVGFDTHFASIQRGVIDSRDLLFYASVILVCLACSVHLLRRRRLAL